MKSIREKLGKISEFVGMTSGSNTDSESSGKAPEDDALQEAKVRVEQLRQGMNDMRTCIATFGRQAVAMITSSSDLASQWSGLYPKSSSRAGPLNTFSKSQGLIEEHGLSLFRDQLGWDVLKTFDDWEDDAKSILVQINKAEQGRKATSDLESKVLSMRAAREKRGAKGLTPKEQEQLDAAEEKLKNYQTAVVNQRLDLDTNLAAFFEQRFTTLDRAFVRFIELQTEFFSKSVANLQSCQGFVENYRKRYPRNADGVAIGTKTSNSTIPSSSPKVAAASATNPAVNNVNLDLFQSSASTSSNSSGLPRPSLAPNAQKKVHSDDEDEESETTDSESGSESESETDSDDDDNGKPHQRHQPHHHQPSQHHQHHAHHQHHQPKPSPPAAQAAPVVDLFNFPASSTSPPPVTTPSSAASNARSNPGDDLHSFFGSAPAPSTSKRNSVKDDIDFDFSGGDSSSVSSSSSASSTSHDTFLQGFDPISPPTQKGKTKPSSSFDPFDPFSNDSSSTASSKKPTSLAERLASTSDVSPTNGSNAALGAVPSGASFRAPPPTHKLDEHIENAQESRVAELRAAEAAQEAEWEAKKEAEHKLEDKLTAWEMKDGVKKNIRTLLSSLHTVIWAGSGWKPAGMADLLDANAIKKMHRKAILIVHPDKLQNGTPEQKVIAAHLFDVLNQAFDRFRETGQ